MKKKKTTGERQENMGGRDDEDIRNAREEEAAPSDEEMDLNEETGEEEGDVEAGGGETATREPEFPKKRETRTGGRGKKQRPAGEGEEEELAA